MQKTNYNIIRSNNQTILIRCTSYAIYSYFYKFGNPADSCFDGNFYYSSEYIPCDIRKVNDFQ